MGAVHWTRSGECLAKLRCNALVCAAPWTLTTPRNTSCRKLSTIKGIVVVVWEYFPFFTGASPSAAAPAATTAALLKKPESCCWGSSP